MARRRVDITIGTVLDPKGLRQGAAEVAKLAAALRGLGKGAPAGNPLGPLTQALPQARAQAQQTERSMLAMARAQATLAKESGNTAGGVRTLERALSQVTQESVASINAQRQLNRYMNELGQGANAAAGKLQVLPRTINGLSGAAASFGRTIAGAFAVEQVVRFGQAAIESANRLEDAKTSLRAIAGDQATYNQTLAVAAQNQRLFGGSLASNVEDMSSFVVSSRLAGVELGTLLDLSQRLATLDPGQGAQGAAIALRELLSGNARSLSARFELPKAALDAMSDSTLSATQKLEALGAFLDSVGITSDAVSGKLENNSQSFRDLAAAGDALQTALGTALANVLAPYAEKLSAIMNIAAQGVNQVTSFNDQLAAAKGAALEGASGYEDYAERIAFVNAELQKLPGISGQLQPLTQAQYELAEGIIATGVAAADAYGMVEGMSSAQMRYAEGLMAGGTAAADAAAQAREYGSAIDAVNSVQGKLYDDAGASSDQLRELGDTMLVVAESSDEGRARVEELAAQYMSGAISSNELEDAVMQLASEQQAAAAAAAEEAAMQAEVAAAAAYSEANSRSLADSLMAQAQATDDSTMAGQAEKAALEAAAQAAQEKANAGASLEEQVIAAAQALYGAGAAGQAAANQLAGSVGGVDQATAAYYRLHSAMQLVGARGGAAGAIGRLTGQGGTGKGTPAAAPTAKGVAAGLVAGGVGSFKPPTGGGGGGGGKPKGGGGGGASAAQQTQDRLAQIASDGGARIASINEQTAARLVEIDRRAAEERLALARQLAEDMATSMADMAAEAEANDLELVGVTDEAERAKLEAREKAEAEALARQEEINRQTRDLIEQGAAEQAEALYETQSEANQKRQKLDEAYYEKQAELAGNPEALAELDKQYQEAVAAADNAARIEQEIADAKAKAKLEAVQQEKRDAIQAADEQKLEVIKRAQEQADGVKGASETARKAVVSDLAAQAQAATDWATATQTAADKAAEAYQKAADAAASLPPPPSGGGDSGGGGGGAAAAGGGTFVTSGPTSLTVGDNPGGVEVVSVTPISGKGATRVAGNMARMAGGGALIAGDPLAGLADVNALARRMAESGGEVSGYAEPLKLYAEAVQSVLSVLSAARELGRLTADDLNPLPLDLIQGLAAEAQRVAGIVRAQLVPLSEEEAEGLDRALGAIGGAIDGLMAAAELRRVPVEYPLDAGVMLGLANDAKRAADIMRQQLLGYTESVVLDVERYVDAAGRAVELLRGVADLRAAARDAGEFPLRPLDVLRMANDAKRAADIIRQQLVGYTEQVAAQVERYAGAAQAAVETIAASAELRARVKEAGEFPIRPLDVLRLANDAKRAADIVRQQLTGYTEQVAASIERYAAAAASATSVLTGAAELRERMKDAGPPLDTETLSRLAADARMALHMVQGSLIPLSEETAEAIARYADTVGSSVSALSTVAGFGADMFTDYESPTDAQLSTLAHDARRIADAFTRAAGVISTEGSEAARAYADALGSTFGAAREGLLLIDALGAREWTVDAGALRQFEQSSDQILSTLERIGARAQAVPATSLTALTSAAEALTSQSEALVALSAVPFGNLPQLAAGLAGEGGGGGPVTINIYQQPGQDANALANLVISRLNAATGARR